MLTQDHRWIRYIILFIVALVSIGTVSALPIASFTATPLSGSYPLIVTFTDTSTGASTWNWNFGDGVTSTEQNPQHTYTYSGLKTVDLYVTDGGVNSDMHTETDYISVNASTKNSTSIDVAGYPKLVQFHVQTIYGKALPNTQVSIIGVTTTTGTYDWVMTLIGIPLDEAPIQNTLMNGTTDSLGNIEFMMVPTTKYTVTANLTGYTFTTISVIPHDYEYTIVADPLGGDGWISPGTVVAGAKIINVTSLKISDSSYTLRVVYNDTSLKTTGGYVNISQGNTVLQHYDITGNTFNITQAITVPIGGTSIKVGVHIIATDGNVNKDYVQSYEGPAVPIGGFDEQIVMWASLFLIIMTAMLAGATSAPQVSIIVCLEAWIFLGIGWLRPLADQIGNEKVVGLFALATLLSVLWNFREGKRKETGR
jgi:PKD repeat protein